MYEFLIMIGVGLKRRICTRCLVDDHSMCTGVGCYQCTHPYHLRLPNVTR